jgi:adenylate kinase family enzyme
MPNAEFGRRVLLLGCSGAGKSTLAVKLAARLGLPLIHSDHLIWRPQWVLAPADELERDMTAALAGEAWLMDGMLPRYTAQAVAAADTVVYLDYSPWVCRRSLLKRILLDWRKARPDMRDDCQEKLDWWFLKWVWRWPKDVKPRVEAAVQAMRPEQTLLRFKDREATERWLGTLPQ